MAAAFSPKLDDVNKQMTESMLVLMISFRGTRCTRETMLSAPKKALNLNDRSSPAPTQSPLFSPSTGNDS